MADAVLHLVRAWRVLGRPFCGKWAWALSLLSMNQEPGARSQGGGGGWASRKTIGDANLASGSASPRAQFEGRRGFWGREKERFDAPTKSRSRWPCFLGNKVRIPATGHPSADGWTRGVERGASSMGNGLSRQSPRPLSSGAVCLLPVVLTTTNGVVCCATSWQRQVKSSAWPSAAEGSRRFVASRVVPVGPAWQGAAGHGIHGW